MFYIKNSNHRWCMNINGMTSRIEMSSGEVRFPGQAASDAGFSQKSTSKKNSTRESAAQTNFPRHASAPVKKAYGRKVNRMNQGGSSLLKLTKVLFFMTLCNTAPFFNGLNVGYKLDSNRGRYQPFDPDLFENLQTGVMTTRPSIDFGHKFIENTQLPVPSNHTGEVSEIVNRIATPAFVFNGQVEVSNEMITDENEIHVFSGVSTLHTSLFPFLGQAEVENTLTHNNTKIDCPENVTAHKDLLEEKEWKVITCNPLVNPILEVCEPQDEEMEIEKDLDERFGGIDPYIAPPAPEFDGVTYGVNFLSSLAEGIGVRAIAGLIFGGGLLNQR